MFIVDVLGRSVGEPKGYDPHPDWVVGRLDINGYVHLVVFLSVVSCYGSR